MPRSRYNGLYGGAALLGQDTTRAGAFKCKGLSVSTKCTFECRRIETMPCGTPRSYTHT